MAQYVFGQGLLYITHESVKKTWRNVKTEWDVPQTSQDKK